MSLRHPVPTYTDSNLLKRERATRSKTCLAARLEGALKTKSKETYTYRKKRIQHSNWPSIISTYIYQKRPIKEFDLLAGIPVLQLARRRLRKNHVKKDLDVPKEQLPKRAICSFLYLSTHTKSNLWTRAIYSQSYLSCSSPEEGCSPVSTFLPSLSAMTVSTSKGPGIKSQKSALHLHYRARRVTSWLLKMKNMCRKSEL